MNRFAEITNPLKQRIDVNMDDIYRLLFVILLVVLIVLIYRYYSATTTNPKPISMKPMEADKEKVPGATTAASTVAAPLVNATELPNYISAFGFDKDAASEAIQREAARIQAEVMETKGPDAFKDAMKGTKEPTGNPGKDFSLF